MAEEEPQKDWYVVHTYSGYENRVKQNLEQRRESMGMTDFIFQVIVPENEKIKTGPNGELKKLLKMISLVMFWWKW